MCANEQIFLTLYFPWRLMLGDWSIHLTVHSTEWCRPNAILPTSVLVTFCLLISIALSVSVMVNILSDLIPDSTRVHMNAFGQAPLPTWVPFFIDPSVLCHSSLPLASLVPSWNPEPACVVLGEGVVCTGGLSISRTEPARSSFTEIVMYALLSGSHQDFLVCYLIFPGARSMLFCYLWSTASSRFDSIAVSCYSSAL